MKKALTGLACALALLGGLFLYQAYKTKAAARPRLAYDPSSAGSVTALSVKYLGDSVRLIRVNGNWVTAADSFPADTARMARVLENLLHLETREKVSSDAPGSPGLAEYGLDSTEGRQVQWTYADGRVVRVILGRTSGIDYGSSFWKPADDAGVYRTPGTFVYQISSRSQDWKDTNLFAEFLPADIRSVRVEWTEGDSVPHRFRIDREKGDGAAGSPKFMMREPFTAPAREKEASDLFLHASQFKVDAFVPGIDSQANSAGLDRPVMTVRILLNDGKERVVTAGAFVDDFYRYARHPWHRAPVRVFLWRFNYFKKTAEQLTDSAAMRK